MFQSTCQFGALTTFYAVTFLSLGSGIASCAQTGPFNPEAWPPTVNAAKNVHFVSIDAGFQPVSTNWVASMKILTGGDHSTEPITVGGHAAVKVTGVKFNTADELFPIWANEHIIDILMQVYGDGAFLDAKGNPRYFNFLTGTLPEPIAVDGGSIPPAAKNQKWNWVLFRIPNGLRHMDNGCLVGTIHPKARGDSPISAVSRLSGQNGGTIRLDGLHDLIVRVVAFGERGAFGEPDQINRFAP